MQPSHSRGRQRAINEESVFEGVIEAPQQLLACLWAEDGHGYKLLMPLLCHHQAAINRLVAYCRDKGELPAMVTAMMSIIKRAIIEGQQHVDAMTGAAAQALHSTHQETAEGAALTLFLLQHISGTVWSSLYALSLQQPLYQAMCSSHSTIMEAAASAIELWWEHLEANLDYDDDEAEEEMLHAIAPMLQRAASDLQQHHSVSATAYMYMARWTHVVQQHVPVLLAVLQEQQLNSKQQEQQQHAICKVFVLAALVHIASEAPASIAAHNMPS